MKLVDMGGLPIEVGYEVKTTAGPAVVILVRYPVIQIMFTDEDGAQTGAECEPAQIGAQWVQ